MYREYAHRFGADEEDLGRVAIALREHAVRTATDGASAAVRKSPGSGFPATAGW